MMGGAVRSRLPSAAAALLGGLGYGTFHRLGRVALGDAGTAHQVVIATLTDPYVWGTLMLLLVLLRTATTAAERLSRARLARYGSRLKALRAAAAESSLDAVAIVLGLVVGASAAGIGLPVGLSAHSLATAALSCAVGVIGLSAVAVLLTGWAGMPEPRPPGILLAGAILWSVSMAALVTGAPGPATLLTISESTSLVEVAGRLAVGVCVALTAGALVASSDER